MPNFFDFLKTRRSTKITQFSTDGPSTEEIEQILTVASRVPDHGKYCPWYFIVFEGDNRKKAGELLREAYAAENPDTPPAKLDLEAERFLRAPVVIAVVSKIREGKNPQWEQLLSAGAACYNLCLAANALGYGTNWLTEWYTYSPTFKKAFGIAENENIAGFIYIGTSTEKNEERDRPDLTKIVTRWADKTIPLNKGDEYGLKGQGIPKAGFILPVPDVDKK